MERLDTNALLRDVSDDAPCGENLEYDLDFLELELLAQGKEEAQFGATIIAAVPPDWAAVRQAALALFARTIDLRIAIHLARAELGGGGVVEFAAALELIARMLAERWERLHPELDPDDDHDPTSRINALAALVDPATVLIAMRNAALIEAPGFGRVTLRDLDIASGQAEPVEGQDPPTEESIAAAFRNAPYEDLQLRAQALRAAVASLAQIESTLTDHVGAARAIDLGPLGALLRRAAQLVGDHLARRAPAVAKDAAPVAAVPGAESAAPRGGAAGSAGGAISSRADVERAIDAICAYYQSNEPSSPVPLILLRVRRMVAMSFMEIIESMAPEAAAAVRQLGGL